MPRPDASLCCGQWGLHWTSAVDTLRGERFNCSSKGRAHPRAFGVSGEGSRAVSVHVYRPRMYSRSPMKGCQTCTGCQTCRRSRSVFLPGLFYHLDVVTQIGGRGRQMAPRASSPAPAPPRPGSLRAPQAPPGRVPPRRAADCSMASRPRERLGASRKDDIDWDMFRQG